MREGQQATVDEASEHKNANQQRCPNRPVRREREGIAKVAQLSAKALHYVLPHDTKYDRKTLDRTSGFICPALDSMCANWQLLFQQ
jgi:hypothetical protein